MLLVEEQELYQNIPYSMYQKVSINVEGRGKQLGVTETERKT